MVLVLDCIDLKAHMWVFINATANFFPYRNYVTWLSIAFVFKSIFTYVIFLQTHRGSSVCLLSSENQFFDLLSSSFSSNKHCCICMLHSGDLGIDKSIFIKPKTFHLTVLMLKLWNKDRVNAAAEVLQVTFYWIR